VALSAYDFLLAMEVKISVNNITAIPVTTVQTYYISIVKIPIFLIKQPIQR